MDKVLDFVTGGKEYFKDILLRDTLVKLKETVKIEEMYNALLATAVSKVSPLQTEWEFVAAKLYLLDMYTSAYGIKDKSYPHLKDVLTKGASAHVYSKEIISMYSDADIEIINGYIRPDEDLTFTYNALMQFNTKYCKKFNKSTRLELPQITYIRVAMGLCYNLPNRLEMIKWLYDILTVGDATLATPIMMNSLTPIYQYSSCILNTIGNDTWDIGNKLQTAGSYTKGRGGLAFDVTHIQSKGSLTKHGVKASGIVPYIKNIEDVVNSFMQGDDRRGAAVITCHWWHLDIEDFLELKDASSGTPETRALHLKYTLGTNDYLYDKIENNEDVYLFCPKDAQALLYTYGEEWVKEYEALVNRKGIPRKKISARDLEKKYIKYRFQTGNIYEIMLDNVNKTSMTNRYVGSSNLCCVSGSTLLLTKEYGNVPIQDVVGKTLECWNGEAWSFTPIFKTSDDTSMYRVTLSNGESIVATNYHRWAIVEEGVDSDGYGTLTKCIYATTDLRAGTLLEPYKMPSGELLEDVRVEELTYVDSEPSYCGYEKMLGKLTFNNTVTYNCEILEPSRPGELIEETFYKEGRNKKEVMVTKFENEEIALCNLASFNVNIFDRPKEDYDHIVYVVSSVLDNTIDIGKYMRVAGEVTNHNYRYIGLGANNYAYNLASKGIHFDSVEAEVETFLMWQKMSLSIIRNNAKLAAERGRYPKYSESKWAQGILPIDLGNEMLLEEFGKYLDTVEIAHVRSLVRRHGVRNALMMAIAPTASSATSKNLTEAIEPIMFHSYRLEGAVSTQVLAPNLAKFRAYYDTAYSIEPPVLIRLAAIRQLWIDQSQSVNTYLTEDKWNYEYISNLHMLARRLGMKTLYYMFTPKSGDNEACESCSS